MSQKLPVFSDNYTLRVETSEIKAETRLLFNEVWAELNKCAQGFGRDHSIKNFASIQRLLGLVDEEFKQAVYCWSRLFFHFPADDYQYHYFFEQILLIVYSDKRCINESLLLKLLAVFRPYPAYPNHSVVKCFIKLLEAAKLKINFTAMSWAKINEFSAQCHNVNFNPLKQRTEIMNRVNRLCTIEPIIDQAVAFKLPFDEHNTPKILRSENRTTDKQLELQRQIWAARSVSLEGTTTVSWRERINSDLAQMSQLQQQAWYELWQYTVTAKSSTPSQIWLKKGQILITATGDNFSAQVVEWFDYILQVLPKDKMPFRDDSRQAIKGLLWLSSLGEATLLATTIGSLVQFCYTKILGGARDSLVANAGLYALGQLSMQGVVQLSKLRTKIKYTVGLRLVEKALLEASERQGVTPDDLEELSVPNFGLNQEGYSSNQIDDYHVTVRLHGAKHVLFEWKNAHAVVLKNIPAVIKEQHSAWLKTWKNYLTELNDVLIGQVKRLEDGYLNQRQWRFSDWQARFIHHPVLGWLGKRLIWSFEYDGQTQHGMYQKGQFINAQQQAITTIPSTAIVRLWHPIMSTVNEVQDWRKYLLAHHITQPIKQAYREVYFITPAEIETGNYSNRFAHHIIKQHQFAALCKERNWLYSLQGAWDGQNNPAYDAKHWQILAVLDVSVADVDDNENNSGVYSYLNTAEVRFYKTNTDWRTQYVPLIDIPAILFSEVMRDIDLFVGVTSIGTDAATDMYADNADYIDAFSKAELSARAIVRKEVLSNIISKLAIAPRCAFDNKHLIVKGDLRTYKIHLGSSNILMEPNDQYLCIVPSSKQKEASTEGLYLPFEGDHMLSVILSKALLLAADKKIKDEGIVSQIKRV